MRKVIKRLFGSDRSEGEAAPVADKPVQGNTPLTPKLKNSPVPVHRFAENLELPQVHVASSGNRISFVVIVYKMPDQAEKTLYSLSTQYQRGVSEEDYEVIVVENASSAVLGEERACQYGANVRYFYREETLPTPVPAVNFGASQAQGTHIALMVDGARMLSPSAISYMLAANRLHSNALVALPGYHLGPKLQQRSMLEGYCEEVEAELLASIAWPRDGYRLFEISVLSGTSTSGVFKPIGESNCYCVPRSVWDEVGGFDPAFTETGGGQVNLDFFKRTVELPDTVLVVLPGEGSFHQFHGGITTGTQGESRVKAMEDHFNQYAELRGGPYQSPTKRPIYLGSVPDSAMKFIKHGAVQAIKMRDQ
ncbi:MAG: glycosyltransferase family A protein [Halioglobus sp.]